MPGARGLLRTLARTLADGTGRGALGRACQPLLEGKRREVAREQAEEGIDGLSGANKNFIRVPLAPCLGEGLRRGGGGGGFIDCL